MSFYSEMRNKKLTIQLHQIDGYGCPYRKLSVNGGIQTILFDLNISKRQNDAISFHIKKNLIS